jgi:hypothetical protein
MMREETLIVEAAGSSLPMTWTTVPVYREGRRGGTWVMWGEWESGC